LSVNAQGLPALSATANRSAALLDAGSSSNPTSQPLTERLINFNADVTILGASVRLHIGPQGQVLEQSGGAAFSYNPGHTDILVDPINSSNPGTASLSATGASTTTISGTASFHYSGELSSVAITNDSPARLVMAGITVVNPNPQVGTPTLTATDTSK